jgi:hypothetical protein
MRTWKRLSAATAISALLGGLSLVAATPAHAAGTTLKLDRVHCVEETDEVGSDSPYVLVFATSPSNSGAVRFGKWGPGGWDTKVDSGDIYYPNGTIASGVQAGWTLWTVLMEEDDGNDLSAGDLDYIESMLWNQWQASFWQSGAQQQINMMLTFLNAVGTVTGNDDTVAIRFFPVSGSSAGSTVQFTGDGGNYWLRFRLV